MAVVDLRPFAGISHLERLFQPANAFVREQVRRAGQDDVFLLAVVEFAQYQPVSVGMRHHLRDRGDDDFIGSPLDPRSVDLQYQIVARVAFDFSGWQWQTDILDGFHLQPGQRQPSRQLFDGDGYFDEIF